MSTKLLDLEDRIITDEGEVVFKPKFLLERVNSAQPFVNLKCVRDWDPVLFNRRVGDELPDIEFWEDDGGVAGPSEETYDWNVPKKYQELDIRKLLHDALLKKGLTSDEYIQRAATEVTEADKRGMFPFIRCLIYIRDRFRENDVVWGVGRGSSCACLIFFLFDINRVDPVKYEIPMEEFFKPEKITDPDI